MYSQVAQAYHQIGQNSCKGALFGMSSLQNVSVNQVTRYLNAPVSSVGEKLIGQLLNVEHCNTDKDQKEFVSQVVFWPEDLLPDH